MTKLPNDTFVTANQKEETSISNYEAQVIDPISTMNEAVRKRLFGSKKTEIKERFVEVLHVDNDVKLPANINYFSSQNILTEYGSRTFVSVIARINDADAGVPDPELLLNDNNGSLSLSFTDVTRMRSHIGKFYAPKEDLEGKSVGNIEVGDWLVVEFQDKSNFQSGIIKEVYIKKDVSTYVARTYGGGGPSGIFSNPSSDPTSPIATTGDIIFVGGSMSPLVAGKIGAPESAYRHQLYKDGSGLQRLNEVLPSAVPSQTITKVIVNIGGNDGFAVNKEGIKTLHANLVRAFPIAPQFFVMRSPLHLNNLKYRPADKGGTADADVPNKYYITSGQFSGFAPPFYILSPVIIPPRGTGKNAHAGQGATWNWEGSSELLAICTKILKSEQLTASDYTAP